VTNSPPLTGRETPGHDSTSLPRPARPARRGSRRANAGDAPAGNAFLHPLAIGFNFQRKTISSVPEAEPRIARHSALSSWDAEAPAPVAVIERCIKSRHGSQGRQLTGGRGGARSRDGAGWRAAAPRAADAEAATRRIASPRRLWTGWRAAGASPAPLCHAGSPPAAAQHVSKTRWRFRALKPIINCLLTQLLHREQKWRTTTPACDRGDGAKPGGLTPACDAAVEQRVRPWPPACRWAAAAGAGANRRRPGCCHRWQRH